MRATWSRWWLVSILIALTIEFSAGNPSSLNRRPQQASASDSASGSEQQRQLHEDSFCDSQGEGFHSHPSDCAKFVRCVGQGTRSDGSPVLTRFNFYCAPGTVFDPRISVCNFPYAVRGGEGCHAKTAEEIAGDSDNSQQKQGDDDMDKAWTTTTIVPTTATTTTMEATAREPSPEPVASTESGAETTTTDGVTTEAVPTTTNTCQCQNAGTVHNRNVCDVESGQCSCKKNVQGHECDQCAEGHFNLEADNVAGCTACFCFGHSSTCESATGFNKAYIESKFERGTEHWGASNEHGDHISVLFSPFTQDIGVAAPAGDDGQVYFVAPGRFLGDQRRSLGRTLNFTLRITENDPLQSSADVILEGGAGKVAMAIFGDRNPLPSTRVQKYSLRLHPDPEYGWKPQLTEHEFNKLLSNLTAIKIRGTYTSKGTGYLDNVILETARRDAKGSPATWIENCTCPEAYAGQFCDFCAAGFTRATTGPSQDSSIDSGSFVECVPCNCSGRSSKCDPEFGTCVDCSVGSKGAHCEECVDGYFFNSTTSDCEKCPCAEHEPVCRLENGTMFCFAFINETSTEAMTTAVITTTEPVQQPETEMPTTTTSPVSTTSAPSEPTSPAGDSAKNSTSGDADTVDIPADYPDIDSQGLIRS